MDKSHKQVHIDAASSKAETFVGNKPQKKNLWMALREWGAKNRIWYRRKEPRKVKTESHEAQLAASWNTSNILFLFP